MASSIKLRAIREAKRTTDRVAHRCETLERDGPEIARTDPRGAWRTALPDPADLGLGRPRSGLVRRDDQRPGGASRCARADGSALEPVARARGHVPRRNRE